MVDAGSGGVSAPVNPSKDPFDQLAAGVDQMQLFFELLTEQHEDFFTDLVAAVSSLPVEERFTTSIDITREHIESEFGSLEGFHATFGSESEREREQIYQLFITELGKLRDDVLQGVFFKRDPTEELVMSAAIECMEQGVDSIQENTEVSDQVLSTVIALGCRLYELGDSAEPELDTEIFWVVARCLHYLTDAWDESLLAAHPDEYPADQVREIVIEFGAVIAYRDLNISVSRGAELASLSIEEFEDRLSVFNISPRYGPGTEAELNADELIDEQ